MTAYALIDPSTIPDRQLDPDGVDAAARTLRQVGQRVSRNGAAVLSAWQRLATCYETPNDETLFAAMDPVGAVTEEFRTDWSTAAKALETCAEQIRPIKVELTRLRKAAEMFVRRVSGGVDMELPSSTSNPEAPDTILVNWWEHPATRESNNALIAQVNAQVALLWEAHRTCANSINGVTEKPYVVAPGGYDGQGRGVPIDIPTGTPMPWGAAQPRPETCGGAVLRGVVWHGALEGLVGGTVQGVGALVGLDLPGMDPGLWDFSPSRATDTWRGLGLVGFALLPKPYDLMPGGRDSDTDPRDQAANDAFRATVAAARDGAIRQDLRERGDTVAANGAAVFNVATVLGGLAKGAGRVARNAHAFNSDVDTPPSKGSLDAASRRLRTEAALRIQHGVRLRDLKAQIDAIDLDESAELVLNRGKLNELAHRDAVDHEPPPRPRNDPADHSDGSDENSNGRGSVQHQQGGRDSIPSVRDHNTEAGIRGPAAHRGGDHEHSRPDSGADLGFDPHREPGLLGRRFRADVHDPAGGFSPHERSAAKLMAQRYDESWHRRPESNVRSEKNPDAIVRFGPNDPGTVTEIKTLKPSPNIDRSSAIRRDITSAAQQLGGHEHGAILIDGRAAGLSREDAYRGFVRAMGQLKKHGSNLPQRVRIILGDGDVVDLRVEGG